MRRREAEEGKIEGEEEEAVEKKKMMNKKRKKGKGWRRMRTSGRNGRGVGE